MQRLNLPLILGLTLLSACAASEHVTTGTSQVATGLTILAGDGQSAAPGTLLSTPLQVMVHDAAGKGVAGIVVHFSVDTGGGSIALAAATTGSDGTASAGKWTLGSASGTQVLSASASSLAPVKFHAQALGADARTLIDNAPIGASGGDLVYHKAGDALDGLTVSVSPGAYPAGATWKIVADSSTPVPLPAGFSQVGPTLVVSTGQGFADSNVAITMPMNVPAEDAVAPFYFDPTTATLEPIPLIGRSATSATLAAHHFSVELMAIAGTVPTTAPAGSLRTFGSVRVVWVRLPAGSLAGTYTTGFQVEKDNWEFVNNGDYLSPHGICEGMSITEIYYYYFVASTGRPGLYHHFDASLTNPFDNIQGYRFAGIVQDDFGKRWDAGATQIKRIQDIAHLNGTAAENLTASWIALSLRLTHKPVLLNLFGPSVGHAVVAYAATVTASSTVVSSADPNFPKLVRQMTFNGGSLVPVSVSINASATPQLFSSAYAMGVTAEVPLHQIDTRWIEFLAKQAGKELYPSNYVYQYHDSLTDSWIDLAKNDTITITQEAIRLRFNCPGCPVKAPGKQDVQFVTTFKDTGTVNLGFNEATMPLADSMTYLTALGIAYSTPTIDAAGYFEAQNFTVISRPFTLTPGQLKGRSDTAYTFTATNHGIGKPSTKYTWTFGDQTATVIAIGDSTVKHTYADTGQFVVRVQMRDANGILIGADSGVATISSGVKHLWFFASATLTSSSLPAGGIGITHPDTLAFNAINGWLESITQRPGASNLTAIELVDRHCGGVVLSQSGSSVVGAGLPGVSEGIALLALNCDDPGLKYTGAFHLGPMGSGDLIGAMNLTSPGVGPAGGSIVAVMSGTNLSGTIHWKMEYSTGLADYVLDFTAGQLLSPGEPALRQRGSKVP